MRGCRIFVVMIAVVAGMAAMAPASAAPGPSADWSAWRNDAARSAVSAAPLPDALHLRWVRHLPAPAPAWPASQHKIRMDAGYEPVVAGKRLLIASMASDSVTAYDTETGAELWRFYAGGPVRFAPLVWKGRVYAVSDDGRLHCLDLETGLCRWSARGGPDDRLVLGNDRLISMWPARGAPVVWEENGGATLYFAAGLWPFMGVFIQALDPETGAVRWVNSGSGSDYVLQQHGSPAFAGVSPQGYLAANADLLLVPGGRTVPAAYDRRTGAFLYFNVSSRAFDKDAGGYDVSLSGPVFQNHGCLYSLTNGEPLINLADRKKLPGLAAQALGDAALVLTETGLVRFALAPARVEESVTDKSGKTAVKVRYSLVPRDSILGPLPLRKIHFQAGNRLYGSGANGLVGAVSLPPSPSAGLAWTGSVPGEVWTMAPGDGKLFVSTADGSIFCFGDKAAAAPAEHGAAEPARQPPVSPTGGVALVWGLDAADAFDRLAALSRSCQVIAVDPDARRVDALRRRLDDAGLYGSRVHVLRGEPAAMPFPPYLASRIAFIDFRFVRPDKRPAFVQSVFHALRPYGGTAVVEGPEAGAFSNAAAALSLPGGRLAAIPDGVMLVREGALPGSGSWTHQYGDPANTVMAPDNRVKPPLGLLWFGGPANDDILPRHGHGPSPQVVGGRLFIEGPDALRAVDVYTGRLLWQREFKELGKYYDNTSHQPGAGEIGGNYVSLADGIYLVHRRKCLRLDPATGATLHAFSLPRQEGRDEPNWGYVGVYGNRLIAGSSPLSIQDAGKDKPPVVEQNAPYASSSESLAVMDRHTGALLWQRRAGQVFRHNAIASGGGLVFCIDALSKASQDLLKRRGEQPDKPARLLALDAQTGDVRWQVETNVFGTWLSYSEEYDILLEAGSPSRDRAKDEAKAYMAAYRGKTGARLWREKLAYSGTPILHGATIYTEGAAVDLLTGNRLRRENPVTGEAADWTFSRNYGCNTPIAGKHMLLFRSAAAGYYDLNADAGTGNWGGFKSGCTANLIPADGVLNAPDYTRTCTCSYQNQCSLALVPMPGVEAWTFQGYDQWNGRLKRIGINFGAPGDWAAPDGTLWLDYPVVGGKGPEVPVRLEGTPSYFRSHAMGIAGAAAPVTASGLEGACAVQVGLKGDEERPHTVRLYFAEPDAAAGARRFDVRLQGQTVLTNLDVAAEAGGPRRSLVKEFRSVPVSDALAVELKAAGGSARPPLLCGLEVIQEQALRARLRLGGDPSAPAGTVPAWLDVSNLTGRAVSAEVMAAADGATLIRAPVTLPAGGSRSLALVVPAAAVNSGKRMGVTFDFGATQGRFRLARESLLLDMPAPLAVDVASPDGSRGVILVRNRRMDAVVSGRLSASMDGAVILEKAFELEPAAMTEFECAIPPALKGKQAEMVLTATWDKGGLPVPGRFVVGLDLRESKDGAKPVAAEAD